jgi:N-acetylmuramoyl-L-alanine amidase
MWRGWRGAGAALFALLLLSLPTLAGEATVTGARVAGDRVRTRFVADLDRAVSFTVYVLPDPYRVIVDLPDVSFDLPPDIGREARGLIAQYRYGALEPGRARIVMDATGPVLIEKSFLVDPQAGQPARIVVDLVGTDEEAFRRKLESERIASDAAVAAAEADPPGAVAPPRDGRKVIVIDPGHGGMDPGAIGVDGTREKDVVLAFARALRDLLAAGGRYDVVLTRGDDTFVTLRDRVRAAHEAKADLFIAIHADTVRARGARGATIYTLSEKASDREAEAIAQRENASAIIGDADFAGQSKAVTDILIDLVQRESKNHSVYFAKKAVGELRQVTAVTGKPLRSAGFVVLKALDVPSVLIELGYLSNRAEAAQLASGEWQRKAAAAMARAVDQYFATQVAARGD